ncbi:MAG: acyl--CoA ligase [bacterium]|nr:acyl--CoA ligase [bacterium]
MNTIDVHTLVGRRAVARWERLSVGDLFERLTWSRPDQEAIVASHGAASAPEFERLTYRQANEAATCVANALLDRGLQRGDRVLLFCDNSVEALVTKIGIAKAGLVAAPINTMMAPDVLEHLIRLAEPSLAIVDAELWPRVAEAFANTGLRADVTIEIEGGVVDDGISFTDFIAAAGTDEPEVEIHGDDIWELLFTSGTTAMPKAVMISHTYSHLAGQSMALSLSRGLRQEDQMRLVSFLPLVFHSGDQVFFMSVMLAGGTLILGRRPDPAAIAQAISQERATTLWGGAPAMLQALVGALDASPELDASTLTAAMFGWAALAPAILDALRSHTNPDFQVTAIFGQTEAISCHRFWPAQYPDLYARTAPKESYIGVPNPLLASKIVDEHGAEITPDRTGEVGEVVYRSPIVAAGYYRDEDASREAFRGGWFHSGDALSHGEDGQRMMKDRYKDMIKSGGENVSSLRVEAVLVQHPEVATAAVVGLAHDHWGEAVTALVIPAGEGLDPDAVAAWARDRLAGFETPKAIIPVTELPTTVGGKVLKHKLRDQYSTFYGENAT